MGLASVNEKPADERVLKMLREDKGASARKQAAKSLAYRSEKAKAVIPALLSAIQNDGDISVRIAALESLASYDLDRKSAFDILKAVLKSDEASLRSAALPCLAEVQVRSDEVLKLIQSVMAGDTVATVRQSAAQSLRTALEKCLRQYGEGVEGITNRLSERVASSLAETATRDPNMLVRVSALYCFSHDVLNSMKPAYAQVIPVLLRAGKDSEPSVRAEAATALGRISSGNAAALATLLELARDSAAEVRACAMEALNGFPEQADVVVPALVRGLQDPHADARRKAGGTVSYFLKEQVVQMPVIGFRVGTLNKTTTEPATLSKGILVLDIAAKSPAQAAGLAKNDVILQADGKDVSSFLRFRQIVTHHQGGQPLMITVRRGTEKMTLAVSPRPATPGLIEAIPLVLNLCDDRDYWTRAKTLETLVLLGVVPDTAIAELIQALDDDEPFVREPAIIAAVTFGAGRSDQIVPRLVDMLGHDWENVRQAAATMLSRFGAEAKVAVPKLAECLRDKKPDVRKAAAETLAKIVPPADRANIAGLTEALAGAAAKRPPSNNATFVREIVEGSGFLSEGKPEAAVKLLEGVFPKLSPNEPGIYYGWTLGMLAEAHLKLGQFNKSRDYSQQLLNWKIHKHGKEHEEVGHAQYNLSVIYMNLGQFSQSEIHAREATGVLERKLGRDHLDLVKPLSMLAHLHLHSGQLAAAEKLAVQAMEICRKHLPADHPDLAISIRTVAHLLVQRGELGKAEGMFVDAMDAYRQAKGKDDSQVAWFLSGLGMLCLGREDHQTAITHLEKARIILKTNPGEPALEVYVLQLLAAAYQAVGKEEEAAALGKKLAFRALQPSAAGSTSFMFFQLQGLAESAWMDDWITDLSLKNFAIRFGEDHLIHAAALKVAAYSRLKSGKYESSEPLFWRSVSRVSAFEPNHPEVADSLQQLGALNVYRGDWREALDNHRRSRRIIAEYTHRNLPSLSEQEQYKFLHQANGVWLARALSTALAQADQLEACEMSVEWLFNSKGVALNALQERALLAQQSNVPEVQQLRDELRDVRERLAYLVTFGGREQDSAEARQELDQASTRERELSKQLSLKLGDQNTPPRWVTLHKVRQALKPDTVLIEIARFPRFTFEKKHEELRTDDLPEAHYAAWLVPAAGHGSVRLIPLGPAPKIEAAVQKVRDTMAAAPGEIARHGEAESEIEVRKTLLEASRLFFEPLKPHLADTSRLLICPDASLWLLPWETLILDDKYVVERFKISYLVSSRDLLARSSTPTTEAPLVLADPNFFLSRSRIASLVKELVGEPIVKVVDGQRHRGLDAKQWSNLPGTAIEAQKIVPSLERYAGQSPRVYTQDRALEAIVKSVRRPRVLVLSTHGFFLENQHLQVPAARTSKLARGVLLLPSTELPLKLGIEAGSHIENPLLRCGLVFAGANGATALPDDHAGPGDDCILTGLEILGLDLRGTEMVSLSACETSVGQVQSGEGVAGLRQAFHLAGAQNVLASAWKIPDQETATLMSAHFRNLADGADRVEALRNAQLQMIDDRRQQAKAAHPYFWAAFTVSGRSEDLRLAVNEPVDKDLASPDSSVTTSSHMAHIDFARRQFGAQRTSQALSAMNPTQRKALHEHIVSAPERPLLGISYSLIRNYPDIVFLVLCLPPWKLRDHSDGRQILENLANLDEDRRNNLRAYLEFNCDDERSDLAYARAEVALGVKDNATAIDELTTAIDLRGINYRARNGRGLVYAINGDLDAALKDYDYVINSSIGAKADILATAHMGRAGILMKKGKHASAITEYESAIKLTPQNALVHNDLAWELATSSTAEVRDGQKAVRHATKACELTEWKSSSYLDTLAAAYAEAVDFKNAVIWQQKACAALDEASSPAEREELQGRLKLYQSSQPYRQ